MTKTININKPFPTADEREPMRIFPIGWRIPIGRTGDKEEWIVLQVDRETGEHMMARVGSANPRYYDDHGPLSDVSYDQVDWFHNDDIEAHWAGRPDDWD
jgi:hypothetical protein